VKSKPVNERTFVLVKPDGVARGLTGEILSRFERKGLEIVAARMMVADDKLASEHYQEHQGNDEYYDMMKKAILGGPVLAVVLEGEMAITAARQLIGSANPFQSQVGTIRGDFATKMGENLIHGADSPGAAKREIGLWMSDIEPVVKAKAAPAMPVGVTAKQVWGPPKKKVIPVTPTPPKWGAPTDDELAKWVVKFEHLDYQLGESSVAGYGHNPNIPTSGPTPPSHTHDPLADPPMFKIEPYDPSLDNWPDKIMDLSAGAAAPEMYTFQISPGHIWNSTQPWIPGDKKISLDDLDNAFAEINKSKEKVES
jgi:nucleoside-diphosphate kinase